LSVSRFVDLATGTQPAGPADYPSGAVSWSRHVAVLEPLVGLSLFAVPGEAIISLNFSSLYTASFDSFSFWKRDFTLTSVISRRGPKLCSNGPHVSWQYHHDVHGVLACDWDPTRESILHTYDGKKVYICVVLKFPQSIILEHNHLNHLILLSFIFPLLIHRSFLSSFLYLSIAAATIFQSVLKSKQNPRTNQKIKQKDHVFHLEKPYTLISIADI